MNLPSSPWRPSSLYSRPEVHAARGLGAEDLLHPKQDNCFRLSTSISAPAPSASRYTSANYFVLCAAMLESVSMIVNFKDRVVRYRIAYAGAAFAGKSTSLACLAERYRPLAPAGVVAVKTDQDTRLDLVLSRSLSPNRLEVQVGTVPGSLYYAATIREVLRGTDGVVFVADSSARRCRNGNDNLEAWKRYTALLEEAGTPFVIQVNKRDVNDALPVEDVLAGWAPGAVPIHESCASSGRGVIEAFLTVLERAVARGAYPWSWPTPLLE